MNRTKTIALWAFQILFAGLMINAGIAKFTVEHWVELFQKWGYMDGFVYVIGVLEILGGIGLLIPRSASYSAALLAIIMLGATGTRIVEGAGAVTLMVHLIYVLAYVFLAFMRRPSFLRKSEK